MYLDSVLKKASNHSYSEEKSLFLYMMHYSVCHIIKSLVWLISCLCCMWMWIHHFLTDLKLYRPNHYNTANFCLPKCISWVLETLLKIYYRLYLKERQKGEICSYIMFLWSCWYEQFWIWHYWLIHNKLAWYGLQAMHVYTGKLCLSATKDSSGIMCHHLWCHLMVQWHLPGFCDEDEQAFMTHLDTSWMPNA